MYDRVYLVFVHDVCVLRSQKAASPMVIAQCYQMGPAAKIDPLMLIAEAKRVCDNLVRLSCYFYGPVLTLR